MSLQSYFVGLPPALCPGYVAFLAYSEHEGIFYPRGGMSGIPEGIADAYKEFGGEIRFNSRVDKVLTDGKRVCGVELADGTEIRSRIVVSNINAKTLYLDLVGEEKLPAWAKRAIKSYNVSIPAPMIMLGLDAKPDLDAHHTFCYATLDEMNRIWFEDYANEQGARRRVHAHLLAHPRRPVPGARRPSLPEPGVLRALRPGGRGLGQLQGEVPRHDAGPAGEELRPQPARPHHRWPR